MVEYASYISNHQTLALLQVACHLGIDITGGHNIQDQAADSFPALLEVGLILIQRMVYEPMLVSGQHGCVYEALI